MKISAGLKLFCSVSLAVFLLCLPPRPDPRGEGQAGHARLPDIRIQEDLIRISTLRDFRYHPQGQVMEKPV